MYQGEPAHIKVWFHPDVAGYIKEKIWHESQQILPQDDGSIIFEADVAGTDEIRFWIMTWGSKAIVPRTGIFERRNQGRSGSDGKTGMKRPWWPKKASLTAGHRITLYSVVSWSSVMRHHFKRL